MMDGFGLARGLENGSISTNQYVHLKLYDNDFKLFYELYKVDWKTSHGITEDDEKSLIRKWYADNSGSLLWQRGWYDNAIIEYGFGDKGCYCSYLEFCANEFLDTEYMNTLIGDDDGLRKMYDKMLMRIRS